MLQESTGYNVICEWLEKKDFHPFEFQEQTWEQIMQGNSGLVNAPTGCGKTYSVFLGTLIQFINEYPKNYQTVAPGNLQLLWITPLRALAKDIGRAMEAVLAELKIPWAVGIRNGDTSTSERQKQKRKVPEILIITPESLHLLLAQKDCSSVFAQVQWIAVDEWHELIGGKRGVPVEITITRSIGMQANKNNKINTCGTFATNVNLV